MREFYAFLFKGKYHLAEKGKIRAICGNESVLVRGVQPMEQAIKKMCRACRMNYSKLGQGYEYPPA